MHCLNGLLMSAVKGFGATVQAVTTGEESVIKAVKSRWIALCTAHTTCVVIRLATA
jgi:hypothetical protein